MSGFNRIIPKITATIKKYGLIKQGEHILIAVSGGPDSISLLHIFYQLRASYKLKLGVVHFEHGIRGETSLRDAEFVKKTSEQLKLPFYIEHGRVRIYAKEKGISLEAAARTLRYGFFKRVLHQSGAQKLALGHTADDQVEEILRRLLRGTAWVDLAGMPIMREEFIRPLLGIYKDELIKTLEEEGIPYMLDVTNLDTRFYRNRIRYELIPILLRFNPRFKKNLLKMSFIWEEERDWLNIYLRGAMDRCVKQSKEEKQIDLRLFAHYHPALQRRILIKVLQDIPLLFSQQHVTALLTLAFPGGPHKLVTLPKGWFGFKEGNYLFLTPCLPTQPDYYYQIKRLGTVAIKELNMLLKTELVKKTDNEMATSSSDKVYVDFKKVCFPLEIRPYHSGDRFYPFGGKGSKKTKDFFIDLKIPYTERWKYPLVLSQGKIIWVAGLRLDKTIMPCSETTTYLVLEINKKTRLD
jgi:tRNA(Ile)-lysidine synthase